MPEKKAGSIAEWLNEFPKRSQAHWKKRGRPFVTVCYAQSLDGSIASVRGKTEAISNNQTTRLTHRLRASHDAILVGIGTVLSDNPKLTVRHAKGKHPQPIIMDPHLKLPVRSRLLKHPNRNPWVVCNYNSLKFKRNALEKKGCRMFPIRGTGTGIKLSTLCNNLGDSGIRSLMVEGGAKTISRFFNQGAADAVLITIAPLALRGLDAVENLKKGFKLNPLVWETQGNNIILLAKPNFGIQQEP